MDALFMEAVRALVPAYGEREARAVAMLLLEDGFGVRRNDVYAGLVRPFSAEERGRLAAMLRRLSAGEPVQYVLGRCDFCGRTFGVRPGVLIPRPETEELVRWVAEAEAGRPLRLLDAGTGSGCIAVTLALSLPGSRVEAWDVSEEALAVARGNARSLGAAVRFVRRDLLAPPPGDAAFDVIVSNPPYVTERERAEMEPRVLCHEPATALFVPDDDPLRFYRALAALGRAALPAGGRMYLEINRAYGPDVCDLLRASGYAGAELRRDFCGNDRMVRAVR